VKPVLQDFLGQRRELDTAPDGVDAFGADADMVAEPPDMIALRSSPAGFFLLASSCVCLARSAALALAAAAPGSTAAYDGVILLAVKNVFAGELLNAVDGHDAFDE
jgi:hypothetical protein